MAIIATAIYDGIVTPVSGPEVPVEWNRPEDELKLITYFKTTVNPASNYGGAEGGGGETSGGGAGRD